MLWRKMLRDFKENKGANLACIIIILIGLMSYTSFSMVVENLKLSQEAFYSEQDFADGFAKVQAMPLSKVNGLADTEGIANIQGRLVKDVRVLLPDREENVYLRLVSLNPQDTKIINGVELIQGIPLADGEPQIWIDNKFFVANDLELNEELAIIAAGKKRGLRIAGVGRSPEFVYALRTSGDLYPDPRTFGIAFLPLNAMQTLFAQNDAVNDLVFTLQPGAVYEDVEARLKPELEAYGLINIFPRKDQTSHLLLSGELKGLEASAKAVPVLFLSIAGMILYIMLKRIVEQQRGQIGILKAFGYTRREIMIHYLSYALTIGLVGGILGGLLGIALSYPFTSMYQMFFNMPGLTGKFSMDRLLAGILLSLGFSALSGYWGCKRILILEPAEAMRPPAPPAGKKVVLERIFFFWQMLTAQGRMAVRNLSRNKSRAIFVFFGIMLTFAIISLTWSMNDLVQMMLFDQYEKVETYDVKVSLASPLDAQKVSRELDSFPGVKMAEAMAEVPVTLKNNWLQKDVALLGLAEQSSLYNILDKNYNKIRPPVNGLLLSERLAKLLKAKVGTKLTVESPMLKAADKGKELEVVGIVPQHLGVNAYMELGALLQFLEKGNLASSLMLRMDADQIKQLQDKYRQSAAVGSIDAQGQRLKQLRDLMASYGSMIYLYALIGVIIGFAIIYNSSLITLSERSHELASMRVLGMTPAEVLSVVTFEQWFIGIIGMLAGMPMAKLLLVGLSESMSNDVYSMPTIITNSSFIMAFLITTASIWVAQQAAGRKINQLDLVETLKSRE